MAPDAFLGPVDGSLDTDADGRLGTLFGVHGLSPDRVEGRFRLTHPGLRTRGATYRVSEANGPRGDAPARALVANFHRIRLARAEAPFCA